MNVLLITCHPLATSFNARLARAAATGLEAAGHAVQVADLIAEGFDPVMNLEDMGQFDGKPPPADVRREMDRVEWADGIVLVFPVWWWSLPAVLKGWIDRVMRFGWAWVDPHDTGSGHLRPRKILVIATAGDSAEGFERRGLDRSLRTQLDVGTWEFCNFTDVTTRFFFDLHHETRQAVHDRYLVEAEDLGRAF